MKWWLNPLSAKSESLGGARDLVVGDGHLA
jgi:hypothetical protein